MFEPLQLDPAYRRVALVIEEKIMARTLKDGDSLPGEVHLAKQFGVNRSTIREALRELQSKGLIMRREGGKKLFISHPKTADVASGISRALALNGVTFFEIWEAMMIVEPEAAALAARARTLEQIQDMVQYNERFIGSGADGASAVAMTVEFFHALTRCSQNRVLMMAQAPLTRLLAPSLRQVIDQVPQARSRIAVAQQHLIDAIRNRNSDEARSWMEKHIRDFKRGYELAGIPPDAQVAL